MTARSIAGGPAAVPVVLVGPVVLARLDRHAERLRPRCRSTRMDLDGSVGGALVRDLKAAVR